MKLKYWLTALLLSGLFLVGCSDDSDPVDNGKNPPNPNPPTEEYDTPESVKFKTFRGRVMCGYQGWFTAPADEVGSKGFGHYTANGIGKFEPGYCSIEYWPDMTEYIKTYDTQFKYPDGSTAVTFSSADYATADLHFKWMKQYGIGGAIIQRFKSTVEACANGSDTHSLVVLENCIKAAEKYGIAFMLEYDLSGLAFDSDLDMIVDDWTMLNEKFHLTNPDKCPNYLWEKGLPMLGFFGVGLNKGDFVADQYHYMFDNMKGRDGEKGKLSYFAGTGYAWLSSGGSAKPFLEWESVYKRCAVISPWAVGGYSSKDAFDAKEDQIRRDANWCKKFNICYAPVAFPGFSWRNTQTKWKNNGTAYDWDAANKYDQIPRLKGEFLWRQLATYKEQGAHAAFVAMFDEIDEGTAIFKCAHKDKTPANVNQYNPDARFLSYEDDVDPGYYMFLVGEAGKMFAGSEGYSKGQLPAFVAPAPIE